MSPLPAVQVHTAREAWPEEVPSFLILASGQAAEEAAHALKLHLHAGVRLAADHLACLQALQGEPVTLLAVEESIAAADPDGTEAVYEMAGAAIVLEVNLGITDAARFVRQVRAALRQRQAEKDRAKTAARAELGQEFVASLTGLLLESQLALRQAGPALTPTLQRLVGLAEHVCNLVRDPQSGTKQPPSETVSNRSEPAHMR